MPNNFSQIINCETGESTRVEFTDEEQTAHDAELAAFLAQEATDKAEDAAAVVAAQAATDKASANTKLKALGLTDAEIAALVG